MPFSKEPGTARIRSKYFHAKRSGLGRRAVSGARGRSRVCLLSPLAVRAPADVRKLRARRIRADRDATEDSRAVEDQHGCVEVVLSGRPRLHAAAHHLDVRLKSPTRRRL